MKASNKSGYLKKNSWIKGLWEIVWVVAHLWEDRISFEENSYFWKKFQVQKNSSMGSLSMIGMDH